MPRRDRHYSHIEIPEMRNVGLLSITVLFECIVFMCHDFKKHLAAVPVILVCGCVIYFFPFIFATELLSNHQQPLGGGK